MGSRFNHILLGLLCAAPVCLYAASPVVVPPPAQPGAAPAKTAPTVQPPVGVASVAPSAATSAPAAQQPPVNTEQLLNIVLPEAPKLEPSGLSTLRPTAPSAPKAKPAPKKTEAKQPSSGQPEPVAVDPFAGLVGTPVSDSQLNRFVSPEPIEVVLFQEGAPLPECPADAKDMDPCKPVFLNGRRMMILQLRAGAKGPVQMLVHLASGRVETFNLMPAPGPGTVVRIDGAEDGASDARLAAGKSSKGVPSAAGGAAATEQNVELLSRFARGDIPAGFEAVKVSGAPVRFELFDVVQMASWDNGAGLHAHLFQVRARGKTPVVIGPALFRHANVKALALDKETITSAEPAMLYMLEYLPKGVE